MQSADTQPNIVVDGETLQNHKDSPEDGSLEFFLANLLCDVAALPTHPRWVFDNLQTGGPVSLRKAARARIEAWRID